jgi:hypothetical protein
MSKIHVPIGMLRVACRAYPDRDLDYVDHDSFGVFTRPVLEKALGWLTDNPITPTDEQISEFYAGECEAGVSFEFLKRFARWFQWRMFTIPDPRDDRRSFTTPFGKFEIDDRVPPGEIHLHNWNGPTVIRNIGVAPKPEHRQEVFSNKFGSTKAVVCSCGFATTYTVLSNDADIAGMAHFERMHEAHCKGASQ